MELMQLVAQKQMDVYLKIKNVLNGIVVIIYYVVML